MSKISNAVIYFDPPYMGTKGYSKQIKNYEEFYDYVRETAKNNFVFVSEYNMPDDFQVVWEKERKVQQKSNRKKADVAVEKLFIR